jgi:hypothetical protein
VPLPRWFKKYVLSFAVLTILLPLATIMAAPLVLGAAAGAQAQRAAAPPLFLLLAQLFMESTTEAAPRDWAAVIRILNPIGFNAFRLAPIGAWVASAASFAHVALANDASLDAASRAFALWFALLAVVNLGLWVYNLFAFLLLKALPLYFDEQRFAV